MSTLRSLLENRQASFDIEYDSYFGYWRISMDMQYNQTEEIQAMLKRRYVTPGEAMLAIANWATANPHAMFTVYRFGQ